MGRLVRLMPREWVAHDVVEELTGGPLCLKCIATRRRLTRVSVEEAVAKLRRSFVMNTLQPCRECGGHQALILRLAPHAADPRRQPEDDREDRDSEEDGASH